MISGYSNTYIITALTAALLHAQRVEEQQRGDLFTPRAEFRPTSYGFHQQGEETLWTHSSPPVVLLINFQA